jgi:predicted dehydrogenase/nucleoside-diphosphate-sugar epimerase
MTHARLRRGIVGCGRVAEGSHIPAALSSGQVELAALADADPERLASITETYGLSCLTTTSHAELIGHVDAVLLAVPNHLHFPVATRFLDAGAHVLCEKPLTNTASEAQILCEMAEARGLVLAVGYMKRFEPNFALMQRLIRDGFLGRLHRVTCTYGTAGGWAPVSNYNLHRAQAGGGVLMVNGCHLVDRLVSWFGIPTSVQYEDDAQGGVEANATARFEFGSGLVGELTLSKTRQLENQLVLEGERGRLVIDAAQHRSVTFWPVGAPGVVHEISPHPDPGPLTDRDYFRMQIDDFAAAIRTGDSPRVSGRDALASIRVIERCYQARTPLQQPWATETLGQITREPARVRAAAAAGSGGRETVLITGATGFVGSRLCEVLHLATGFAPRALVHSSGSGAAIARYPLDLVMGDLTDAAQARAAVEGCSVVVHLARGSNAVMTRGLEYMLRAAVDAGVRRFVHVSSVAVYGDNPPAAAHEESAPLRKTGNPYGDLKLEQERLVASYGKRFGLPFVILRPPHISGPQSHFVVAVSERITAGRLPIVDGGEHICNLVHVDNMVEAILLAIDAERAVGETFFITDRERVTWRTCLEDFGAMLGVQLPEATGRQLRPVPRPSTRAGIRHLSAALMSREVRSAALQVPAFNTMAGWLLQGYGRLPRRQQVALRRRLRPARVPARAGDGALPSYDLDDYLISSQLRSVVHSCEKAERLLGYTAPVGYRQAMALTAEWLVPGLAMREESVQ